MVCALYLTPKQNTIAEALQIEEQKGLVGPANRLTEIHLRGLYIDDECLGPLCKLIATNEDRKWTKIWLEHCRFASRETINELMYILVSNHWLIGSIHVEAQPHLLREMITSLMDMIGLVFANETLPSRTSRLNKITITSSDPLRPTKILTDGEESDVVASTNQTTVLGCPLLLSILSNLKDIEELYLHGIQLGWQSITQLAILSYQDSLRLTHIDVSESVFTDFPAKCLALTSVARTNSTILHNFASSLLLMKHLRHIRMNSADFDAGVISTISDLITGRNASNELRSLDLSCEDDSMEHVLQSGHGNDGISFMSTLSQAISQSASLRSLTLSRNNLSNECCQSLLAMIAEQNSLFGNGIDVLDLSCCSLGLGFVDAFIHYLPVMRSLRCVFLPYNYISNKDIEASWASLLQSIEEQGYIHTLVLDEDCLGLDQNKRLEYLLCINTIRNALRWKPSEAALMPCAMSWERFAYRERHHRRGEGQWTASRSQREATFFALQKGMLFPHII